MHPLFHDDLGEDANYLRVDQITMRLIRDAWNTGAGWNHPTLNIHYLAVNRPAWNAYAAANDYIDHLGHTHKRTGYQWFLAANMAGLHAAETAPARNLPYPGRGPLCIAPAPTVPHASLTITTAAPAHPPGDHLALAITPNLLCHDPAAPAPGDCLIVLNAQIPKGFRPSRPNTPSFSLAGAQFTTQVPFPGPYVIDFFRNPYHFAFGSALPEFLVFCVQYVHVASYPDAPMQYYPITGSIGPQFWFSATLLPGYFW